MANKCKHRFKKIAPHKWICIYCKAPKTRDWLLLKLINGSTKGGAHTDHKKETDKLHCRKPIKEE